MKLQLRIDGETPLLQASAIGLLLPTDTSHTRNASDIPPAEQAAGLVYKTREDNFGHPTSAFRTAFITAAQNFKFIKGRGNASKPLAAALSIEPSEFVTLVDRDGTPLQDYTVDVRIIQTKTKARLPSGKPRHDDWHCFMEIDLDERVWPESALPLFREICDYAGRAIGVGSGRPELRKLSFGKFGVTEL